MGENNARIQHKGFIAQGFYYSANRRSPFKIPDLELKQDLRLPVRSIATYSVWFAVLPLQIVYMRKSYETALCCSGAFPREQQSRGSISLLEIIAPLGFVCCSREGAPFKERLSPKGWRQRTKLKCSQSRSRASLSFSVYIIFSEKKAMIVNYFGLSAKQSAKQSVKQSAKQIISRFLFASVLAMPWLLGGVAPNLGGRSSMLGGGSVAIAQSLSDEEVRQFAQSLWDIEQLRLQVYDVMKREFGNIPEIDCSDPNSVNGLATEVSEMAVCFCDESKKIVVENNNLRISQFNAFKKAYEEEPAVQALVDAQLSLIQEESSGNTPNPPQCVQ